MRWRPHRSVEPLRGNAVVRPSGFMLALNFIVGLALWLWIVDIAVAISKEIYRGVSA